MTKAQEFEQFIDRLGLRYFKGKEFTQRASRFFYALSAQSTTDEP